MKEEPKPEARMEQAVGDVAPVKQEEPAKPVELAEPVLLADSVATATAGATSAGPDALTVDLPSSAPAAPAKVSFGPTTLPLLVNPQVPGKMFIGGLNWDTTEEGLRDYFAKFGEVQDFTVMRDAATGKLRGFGFLTFKDGRCVDTVLAQQHVLDGKLIDPKRAIAREDQDRTGKIFVGGISTEVTEEDYLEFFGQFGNIVDAQLMMDKATGRNRGFGFVTYDTNEAVDAVVRNKYLQLKGKYMEVKRAEPRAGGGGHVLRHGFLREHALFYGQQQQQQLQQQQLQQQQQQQMYASMAGSMDPSMYANMTPEMMQQYYQQYQQMWQQYQQMQGGEGAVAGTGEEAAAGASAGAAQAPAPFNPQQRAEVLASPEPSSVSTGNVALPQGPAGGSGKIHASRMANMPTGPRGGGGGGGHGGRSGGAVRSRGRGGYHPYRR